MLGLETVLGGLGLGRRRAVDPRAIVRLPEVGQYIPAGINVPEYPAFGPVAQEVITAQGYPITAPWRAGSPVSQPFVANSLPLSNAQDWYRRSFMLYGDTPIDEVNTPAGVAYESYKAYAMGDGVGYEAPWLDMTPVQGPAAGVGYGQAFSGARPIGEPPDLELAISSYAPGVGVGGSY